MLPKAQVDIVNQSANLKNQRDDCVFIDFQMDNANCNGKKQALEECS